MNNLFGRAATACLLSIATVAITAAGELDPRLAPLAPYVDRTFTAHMGPPGNVAATVDVQRWETILGGKAVRITHSMNGGDYGGESLIMWDVATESIRYWYVTTADFHTVGTMSAAGDSLVTLEEVVGNAGGITRVEGVWRRTTDGLSVTSRMEAADQWQPRRVQAYVETPDAVPTFR
ncbi:MAG: hypothetical protein IPK64_03145 [bacterium]|nr:hypothetical protein [bacterium]